MLETGVRSAVISQAEIWYCPDMVAADDPLVANATRYVPSKNEYSQSGHFDNGKRQESHEQETG